MPSPILVSRDDPPNPTQCFIHGFSPLGTRLTTGAQFLGNSAAWLFLGFISAQTYTYCRYSRREPIRLKILVYGLAILVAVKRAVSNLAAYRYLVSGRGNPLFLAVVDATTIVDDLQSVFVGFLAIFVQFFFTWRIWTFCQCVVVCGRRMKLLVAAICVFIVCTSICALVSAITYCGIFISPRFYPASLGRELVLVRCTTYRGSSSELQSNWFIDLDLVDSCSGRNHCSKHDNSYSTMQNPAPTLEKRGTGSPACSDSHFKRAPNFHPYYTYRASLFDPPGLLNHIQFTYSITRSDCTFSANPMSYLC